MTCSGGYVYLASPQREPTSLTATIAGSLVPLCFQGKCTLWVYMSRTY